MTYGKSLDGMALPRGRGVSPRDYRKTRPSQQVVMQQCMTLCMPIRHAVFRKTAQPHPQRNRRYKAIRHSGRLSAVV